MTRCIDVPNKVSLDWIDRQTDRHAEYKLVCYSKYKILLSLILHWNTSPVISQDLILGLHPAGDHWSSMKMSITYTPCMAKQERHCAFRELDTVGTQSQCRTCRLKLLFHFLLRRRWGNNLHEMTTTMGKHSHQFMVYELFPAATAYLSGIISTLLREGGRAEQVGRVMGLKMVLWKMYLGSDSGQERDGVFTSFSIPSPAHDALVN